VESTCINCAFFKSNDGVGTKGQCRRFPPTVAWSDLDDTPVTMLPLITEPITFYCGEYWDGKDE
jgi:hypothetical protein